MVLKYCFHRQQNSRGTDAPLPPTHKTFNSYLASIYWALMARNTREYRLLASLLISWLQPGYELTAAKLPNNSSTEPLGFCNISSYKRVIFNRKHKGLQQLCGTCTGTSQGGIRVSWSWGQSPSRHTVMGQGGTAPEHSNQQSAAGSINRSKQSKYWAAQGGHQDMSCLQCNPKVQPKALGRGKPTA